MIPKDTIDAFAAELRKWWRFDDRQHHTHTWHTREDFIEQALPGLLTAALSSAREAGIVLCNMSGGLHEGTCPTCGCEPLPVPEAIKENL